MDNDPYNDYDGSFNDNKSKSGYGKSVYNKNKSGYGKNNYTQGESNYQGSNNNSGHGGGSSSEYNRPGSNNNGYRSNDNNKGGYNKGKYNNGGGKNYKKKKYFPPDVYLPVVLLFESCVKETDIHHSLPDILRYCTNNGFSVRVKASSAILSFCQELHPDIFVINNWDGFGDMKADLAPTKYESTLATKMYPWIEKQKESMATFMGCNLTAILGNAYHGRAYACVTFTENGINNPKGQTDQYKYMSTPLEICEKYHVPVINLGRSTHMDDLRAVLPDNRSQDDGNNYNN